MHRRTSPLSWTVGGLMLCLEAASLAVPAAGTRLSFDVLSTRPETAPPFVAVDVLYGPKAKTEHGRRRAWSGQWWQLEIRTTAEAGAAPLCVVRGLTVRDPLAGSGALDFARYQLRIPATGETLEYVDAHSERALLPAWMDWEKYFVPWPTSRSTRVEGVPLTCDFLGHVLSLRSVKTGVNWEPWPAVKRLELDREMLVGTGRNFKDVEGHRLPQSPQARDYTYTNFTATDYQTMIAAGMNLFTVAPEQQRWVQSEPVFFLRSAAGNPPLDYPVDLYRANYLGAAMFVDEPASIMTWDRTLGPKLKHLSDVTTLIEKRTALTFETNTRYYGRYWLEQQLRDRRVNLGDLRLAQLELPVWETYYDRAFYEMKGGGSGIVHEGRYRLQDFDEAVARIAGQKRSHTVRQMLQWYYAPLRGGARAFAKFWGTSIYGQCEPAVAPEALEVAYDMGARYFWFWTSDHGHHVPWPEQLALARSLQQYARAHPRRSLYAPQPKVDTLITIPDGYFAALTDISWIHLSHQQELQKYHRVVERALKAAETCFERGREFDLAIDDGHPIRGYKRVIRITDR